MSPIGSDFWILGLQVAALLGGNVRGVAFLEEACLHSCVRAISSLSLLIHSLIWALGYGSRCVLSDSHSHW